MGCGPVQYPPRCTKCNSPHINGQCTNFILFDMALKLPLHYKGLISNVTNLASLRWVEILHCDIGDMFCSSDVNFGKLSIASKSFSSTAVVVSCNHTRNETSEQTQLQSYKQTKNHMRPELKPRLLSSKWGAWQNGTDRQTVDKQDAGCFKALRRAMLRVCQHLQLSSIPRAHSFIISYFGFMLSIIAYN